MLSFITVKVWFHLRSDTRNYPQRNLKQYESILTEGIKRFHLKDARHLDKASMKLVSIDEKEFCVIVKILENYGPQTRNFFNRVGALSRDLKQLGFEKFLSPHGKLFNLSVESLENDGEEVEAGQEALVKIDYSKKLICISKDLLDFGIKFV